MKYGIKFTQMAGTYQHMLVIPDDHGFEKEYPIYEGNLAWYIARVKDNVLYEAIINNVINDVINKSSTIESLEERLRRNIEENFQTMHFIIHCFSWAKAKACPVHLDWAELYASYPNKWMYDTIEEAFEDLTRQVREQPPMPIEQQENIANNINQLINNL